MYLVTLCAKTICTHTWILCGRVDAAAGTPPKRGNKTKRRQKRNEKKKKPMRFWFEQKKKKVMYLSLRSHASCECVFHLFISLFSNFGFAFFILFCRLCTCCHTPHIQTYRHTPRIRRLNRAPFFSLFPSLSGHAFSTIWSGVFVIVFFF